MREITSLDFLLLTGTFFSIYLTLFLHGYYGVNAFYAITPMVLWVGAYELGKAQNKRSSTHSGGKR